MSSVLVTSLPLALGGRGLEVARPGVLWALLLVVPLVLLHLYRRRRLVVPFLPLLVEAIGPRRSGGGWHKLREVASLVLRVLALAAVVLALAGLAPARGGPPPPALFVVIDADVTTRARESDGASRYAHTLELARAAVESDTWTEVSVVEAREAPLLVVPRTADRAEVVRILSERASDARAGRLEAAAAPADLGPALDLATSPTSDRTGTPETARVRVLCCTARSLPDAAAGDPGVEVWGAGRTDEDQGIVAFEVAEAGSAPTTGIRVEVRNEASGPRSRALVFRRGSEEVERRLLTLGPGAVETVTVDLPAASEGAWLRVSLEETDAFAGNDRVSAWLAADVRPSVLVVRAGAVRPYTEAVLQAMQDEIDLDASGSVDVRHWTKAGARDVVVVDGVALPPGTLRPGAYVFLAPLAGALPFTVATPLVHPLVWRTDPDHPLVRDLDLGDAYVVRGFPVEGEGVVPLAEADGQAVVAEGEKDGVRYVVLGLDPEGSDLPLRAALPLLVKGAVLRLAAQPARPLAPCYRAGGTLRPRLPLPGGPAVDVAWEGRHVEARLSPDGKAWTIPPGAHGEVEVQARDTSEPWRGRTAFVDVSPERSIRPARPAHPLPPPRRLAGSAAYRWRRALLVLAGLLLLADLLLLAARGRPSGKLAGASALG